jgi:two-component sensor histidine kinase
MCPKPVQANHKVNEPVQPGVLPLFGLAPLARLGRRNSRIWWLIIAVSWVIYLITFAAFYPIAGRWIGPLITLPIAVMGWVVGVRKGIFASLVGLTVNQSLLYLSGDPILEYIVKDTPGLIMGLLTGPAIGLLGDVFYNYRSQSVALAREQTALQEQIQKRLQAEEALRQANLDLEQRVTQRTDELAQTIIRLREENQARQAAQEQIQASLREKEVLLREIHHRVKNNLQIISSLLNLHIHRLQDPAAIAALRDSQERVRSMALIHERLYQSETLAEIDFAEYAHILANSLFETYAPDPGKVRLEMNIEPVYLGIHSAVPAGLILNELISNSLKHAFPNCQPGVIQVNLSRAADQTITLQVADNGVGMDETQRPPQTASLGIRLVQVLSDQLGARLEVLNHRGVTTKLHFNG